MDDELTTPLNRSLADLLTHSATHPLTNSLNHSLTMPSRSLILAVIGAISALPFVVAQSDYSPEGQLDPAATCPYQLADQIQGESRRRLSRVPFIYILYLRDIVSSQLAEP